MAAGEVITMGRVNSDFAQRFREAHRLLFELQSMKSSWDAIVDKLSIPTGGAEQWVQGDVDTLNSALNDLVNALAAWDQTFAARLWGFGF